MSVNPEKEIMMDGRKTDKEIDQPAGELTLRSGLAAAGGFMATFVSVGFLNSFGVFQSYYSDQILSDHSNFDIALLGSFANFSLYLFGLLAGWLSDRYGPTIPMIGGSVAIVFAVFMISLCTEYYQFFLAQGFLLGTGMSFILIPVSGTMSKYFVRHRGAATGIVAAGSSLGGVVWPILFDQLFYRYRLSFGWSFRIAGFVMLPILAFAIVFGRAPLKHSPPGLVAEEGGAGDRETPDPKERRSRVLKVLRQPPFVLLCAGLFFFYLGFQAPIFYTPDYAEYRGISTGLAFYLISMLNAASLFGRILPGFLSDRFGRFNLIAISALGAGIVGFCWSSAASVAGVIVWVCAYGFTSGTILTLQFACPATLGDKESSGALIGAASTAVSIACLFGAPIAGEVVGYGYVALSCYTGATLLAGGVFMLLSRLAQNKEIGARV